MKDRDSPSSILCTTRYPWTRDSLPVLTTRSASVNSATVLSVAPSSLSKNSTACRELFVPLGVVRREVRAESDGSLVSGVEVVARKEKKVERRARYGRVVVGCGIRE